LILSLSFSLFSTTTIKIFKIEKALKLQLIKKEDDFEREREERNELLSYSFRK